MAAGDRRGIALSRVLPAAVVVLLVLLPVLLMRRYAGGDAGVHARHVAFGCIFAVGAVAIIGAGLANALQKRALAAALNRNAPIRTSITRARRTIFALAAFLLGAGSVVAAADPTISMVDGFAAVLMGMVMLPLGLIGLVVTARKLMPITIGPDGLAYPVIWEGTIPWNAIRAATSTGAFDGVSYVIVTIDPAAHYPLASTYRRIAERLKLRDDERPIPATAFGMTPETLLARIERSAIPPLSESARPAPRQQYTAAELEANNRKYGDGLTSRQRADLVYALGLFLLVFLPTYVGLFLWERSASTVNTHAAVYWTAMIAIIAGALVAWVFLLLKNRHRAKQP